MYNFYASYTTVAEMVAKYSKRVREFERQNKYERSIVRSVPERAIVACSVEPTNSERWEPG